MQTKIPVNIIVKTTSFSIFFLKIGLADIFHKTGANPNPVQPDPVNAVMPASSNPPVFKTPLPPPTTRHLTSLSKRVVVINAAQNLSSSSSSTAAHQQHNQQQQSALPAPSSSDIPRVIQNPLPGVHHHIIVPQSTVAIIPAQPVVTRVAITTTTTSTLPPQPPSNPSPTISTAAPPIPAHSSQPTRAPLAVSQQRQPKKQSSHSNGDEEEYADDGETAVPSRKTKMSKDKRDSISKRRLKFRKWIIADECERFIKAVGKDNFKMTKAELSDMVYTKYIKGKKYDDAERQRVRDVIYLVIAGNLHGNPPDIDQTDPTLEQVSVGDFSLPDGRKSRHSAKRFFLFYKFVVNIYTDK